MANVISYSAIVKRIKETKQKTRRDGKPGRSYQPCIVEYLDGPMKGKQTAAQRTLGVNAQGIEKLPVSEEQQVRCILEIVERPIVDTTTGQVIGMEEVPYFEISTSEVLSAAEVLSLVRG